MLQPRSSRVRSPASTEDRASANEKQKQRRRKGRSAQDWAQMKSVIYRYYIEEEKTHNEIVDLLKNEHSFVIELNMLKRRCKQWGFRKYFTSTEHETVETEFTRCAEQGTGLPADFKVNGRLPHLDRVFRRSRKKPQLASSFLQKSSEWHAQVSRICLKASSADHCTEMTLMQTKVYWTAALTKPVAMNLTEESVAISLTEASAQKKRSTQDPYTLTIGFLMGLRLINKGQKQQGWQEIDNTCEKATKVLQMQQPDLLTGLLSLFCAKSWSRHAEILFLIVKYLLGFSHDHLGTEHPLSKMLDAFVTLVAAKTSVALEVYEVIPELASKVIVDLTEGKQSQSAIDPSYIHSVEVDLVTRVRIRLGPLAVRKMIEKKYSHWRSTLGPRNRHTLSMRLDLAKTFLDEATSIDRQEKQHERLITEQKGETILRKIVAQGEKFPADRYRIGSYYLAAEYLARLYFAKQDFTSAHTFFLRAVLWATEKLGCYHSYTGLLLTDFRALRKLVKLGLIDVPAKDEHLWHVHMCKEGSAKAVEEGDWAPHHDEIDLEDNLEPFDNKVIPQTAVEGVLEPMDDNHSNGSNGALSQADLDLQSQNADDFANQYFEYRHMEEARSSHASELDASMPSIWQDAPFAAEITFEGLLNASAQDVLELFPEDHVQHEAQLDDSNESLMYCR